MAVSARDIIKRFKHISDDRFMTRKDRKRLAIGGKVPATVLRPGSEQEVVDIVAACRGARVRVVPVGSTHQLGELFPRGDVRALIILSTRRLNTVLSYSYEDMTATVACGALLAEFQGIAVGLGQHLPVDPPLADAVTVGGLIAANASGPRRLLHGGVADAMLGAAMVMADGSLVHSGAQTVKSVAGYDLHKLMVGSFGSLGIVTQATFKLKPVPEDFRLVRILTSGIEDAEYIAGQLTRSSTRPCMVELFDLPAARDLDVALEPGQASLFVGYEDSTEAVEWQISELEATFGTQVKPMDRAASEQLHRRISDWPAGPCDYAFEAVVLGAKWNEVMNYCAAQGIVAVARIGCGLIYGRGRGDLSPQTAAELRHLAGPGGSVRFSKLPAGSPVSPWGDMDQARKWMRAVKKEFDPEGVFPWPGFLG